MILPYGIEEQYIFFKDFLSNPHFTAIHVKNPYYETSSILTIAIQDWEKEQLHVHIQYIESDTCSKRILTTKNQVKTIQLDIQYESGWVWKTLPTFTTSVRIIQ